MHTTASIARALHYEKKQHHPVKTRNISRRRINLYLDHQCYQITSVFQIPLLIFPTECTLKCQKSWANRVQSFKLYTHLVRKRWWSSGQVEPVMFTCHVTICNWLCMSRMMISLGHIVREWFGAFRIFSTRFGHLDQEAYRKHDCAQVPAAITTTQLWAAINTVWLNSWRLVESVTSSCCTSAR